MGVYHSTNGGTTWTLTSGTPTTFTHMVMGQNGVLWLEPATYPENTAVYKYEGSTSKTTTDVLFNEDIAPGTKVWLTAFFFNERKQNGPACTPVPAIINYATSMPMAA